MFSKSINATIVVLSAIGSVSAVSATVSDATQHQEAVNHQARFSGIVQSMKQEANRQRTSEQHISETQAKTNQNAAYRVEAVNHQVRFNGIVSSMKNSAVQQQERDSHVARYAGMNPNQAATGTINVAASSLPANTPVQTPDGIKTAGSLPVSVQVTVPHVDAIISSPDMKGGQQSHNGTHSTGEHSGNGSNNDAGSNSAHGLGGGSHIGGGSAMGGGFHGQW